MPVLPNAKATHAASTKPTEAPYPIFAVLVKDARFINGRSLKCGPTSRAQARGADDVVRDSGTGPAIPRSLQRFVRRFGVSGGWHTRA